MVLLDLQLSALSLNDGPAENGANAPFKVPIPKLCAHSSANGMDPDVISTDLAEPMDEEMTNADETDLSTSQSDLLGQTKCLFNAKRYHNSQMLKGKAGKITAFPKEDESDSEQLDQDEINPATKRERNIHWRIAKFLETCGQTEEIPIGELFDDLKGVWKVGEGSFGEVYAGRYLERRDARPYIFKIIAAGGYKLPNGMYQKPLTEVKQEIMISQLLNTLRETNRPNYTTGFAMLYEARLVKGEYPDVLLEPFRRFARRHEMRVRNPNYEKSQRFLVMEYEFAGKCIMGIRFNNAIPAYYQLIQVTLALAAAERGIEFEHRDLHVGNLVTAATKEVFQTYKIDGATYKVPTGEYKTTIIDFTLSRATHSEFGPVYLDLSKPQENGLFEGEGSIQCDIYRHMEHYNGTNWKNFTPRTNVAWLWYLAKKMYQGGKEKDIQYINFQSKIHRSYKLKIAKFYRTIIGYDSVNAFVQAHLQEFKQAH